MHVEINTRHFTLGDDQRTTIENLLEKLARFCPRPVISIQMNIGHDAGRFTADAVLHLKVHEFRASATGAEPEDVAGEVVENLRRQLTKFKGKTSARQTGEEGGLGAALPGVEVPEPDEEPDTGALVLKDMDLATARSALVASGQPFLVFRNVDSQQVAVIYHQDDGTTGHLESADS